jgi:transketolase
MGGARTASPTTAGSSRTSATFLNFSDYMRGSVRLAALAGLHVIYVWTHDSVGLGEDGPTHQPVEHYAALRAMPNLWFVRPGRRERGDAAWRAASSATAADRTLAHRQKLPTLAGTAELAEEAWRAAATCSAGTR